MSVKQFDWFQVAVAGILGTAVLAGFLFIIGRSFAKDEPVPAEVTAADAWLEANVPEIKQLKARLAVLEPEKEKRQAVLSTFGYDYDWEKLEPVKQVFPTR
jgi:hypothetical protein